MKASIIIIIFSLIATLGFSQKKTEKRPKSKKEDSQSALFTEEKQVKLEATLVEAEKQLVLENTPKAIELFQVALELDPKNGAANFKLAETLTKMGNVTEALSYALAALESDRTNKYYFLLAAEVYKATGDFDTSAELYAEMIKQIPGTESYLFDLAIIYQYMADYDKALATYKRAEEIFGINEMVLREKQKIYFQNKDYPSLIADWDRLIAENSDNSRYTIELVEFLIGQGLLMEAKERLDKIEEDNIHAHLLRSQIAMKEGKTDESLLIIMEAFETSSLDFRTKIQLLNSYLDNAITIDQFENIVEMAKTLGNNYPEKFEAQAYAGDVLLRMEKQNLALAYYLRAVKITPSSFSVWQNILNIEASLNQYDSMIVHSNEALEYFPNQAILYYFSGTGYLLKKNYQKSIQMLEMGTKYASEPSLLTVFYGQMGDAYNSLKQTDKSYASYEKALKNNPANDHVLNNYSYFLSLDKQNLDKAMEMSTKLVNLHPDNPTYLDTHGWVLYTFGKYEDAEKYLRKAANLQEDGTIIEHYGDVLFKLGKTEEAVKQWEKASKMKDTSDNIQKKIADKTLYE
ncbi:MAG: tetratricopeptide (TPR) repeat protein [Cyclobacteriaceae bacterium]|jgi:tetratricopeptide (TPR) repeat protein